MENLHPGAKWLFRLRSYTALFPLLIFIIILGLANFAAPISGKSPFPTIIISAILGIVILVFISEIYTRMSYSRFLYELTKEGIKIEKGIIWKKYTSIPYERVQNVDIKRGIIARMFGFSTVDIETAGQQIRFQYRFNRMNDHQGYQSEGHLPAIDLKKAEEHRSFIMKKIKKTHNSGM